MAFVKWCSFYELPEPTHWVEPPEIYSFSTLQAIKETLKNDPISLFPPLESVIFDLAARFNPFLGSFWVF